MINYIFTGPESTGKTTLAKTLAAHFSVPLADEYVREFFFQKKNNSYTLSDLKTIAEGQIKLEEIAHRNSILQKKDFFFSDTDLITIKIWSEEVFGICDDFILKKLCDNHQPSTINHQPSTKIYFLCSPKNIPWEPDPLRENPNDRERLYDIYKKTLIEYKKQFIILEGDKEKKFFDVVNFIEKM